MTHICVGIDVSDSTIRTRAVKYAYLYFYSGEVVAVVMVGG